VADQLTAAGPRPQGRPFTAELDLVEFDDRGRPVSMWSARAISLSRSNLLVHSRRMIYPQSLVGVLVHLIDATPVVLLGRVFRCDYDSDGMHRVDLDLLPMPQTGPIAVWAKNIAKG